MANNIYPQRWELMICEELPGGSLRVLDTKTLLVRLNDTGDDVLVKYKGKEYVPYGGLNSRYIVVASQFNLTK